MADIIEINITGRIIAVEEFQAAVLLIIVLLIIEAGLNLLIRRQIIQSLIEMVRIINVTITVFLLNLMNVLSHLNRVV